MNTEYRIPPHDEQAEKALIGSVLLTDSAAWETGIQAHVTAESFHIPAHRMIWEAFAAMSENGRPIDTTTVANHLQTNGTLDKIGGHLALDNCIDACPTSANAAYYAEIVRQKHKVRKIIAAAREAERLAYDGEGPDDLAAATECVFASIGESGKVRQDAIDVFTELIRDVERAQNGEEVDTGISTGLRGLDHLTDGGLLKKGVYYLAGEAKSGKTSLAVNIASSVASHATVAIATMEMSTRQLLQRIVSARTGIRLQDVLRRRAIMDGGAFGRVLNIGSLLKSKHLMIDEHVGSVSDLAVWGRRAVEKHGARLLVVDYLQKIGQGDGAKEFDRVTAANDAVVSMARRLNVAVLCLSSLSNDGNFRGTGQIQYDGYATWRLSVDDTGSYPDWRSRVTLHVERARFSGVGSWPFIWHGKTGEIEEVGNGYDGAPADGILCENGSRSWYEGND